MSKFCNDNVSLKSVNTRKAPDIELDRFKEYLTDYYNMFAGVGDADDYPFDLAESEEFIKAVYPGRYSTDFPAFASSFQFISDSEDDPKLKSFDPENSLMGIHVLSNGLPVYGFTLGGEEELPYFAIMYWNGDHFRIYIPAYGNTYNADLKAAFMNEGNASVSVDEMVEFVEDYESALGKTLDDIECPGADPEQKEMLQAAVAYCIANHYADTEAEAMDVMNTVSWEAIQEDIISNIEITDEIEDDRTVSEREYKEREKKRLEEEEEISKMITSSYEDEEDEEGYDEEDEEESYASYSEEDEEDEEDEEGFPTSAPRKSVKEVPPAPKKAAEEEDWLYDDEDDDSHIPTGSSTTAKKMVEVDDVKSQAFCNRDKSYIRIGKNKASDISLEDLKSEIEKFYKKETEGTIYEDDEMDADVLVEALLAKSTVKTNLCVFTAAIDDAESSIINNGEGDSLIGFHTLPNGVSILGFEVNDGGGVVYGCAYYDGENIRSYVPNYGNTINADSGTSFGICGKNTSSFLVKRYETMLKEKIEMDEKGCYDNDQLTRAYFLSNGYDDCDIEVMKKTVCWQAILLDLIFSMTV